MPGSIHVSKLAYSLEDFCDLVGLTRTGAFKEIREGRLHAIKIGRRFVVPAAEVKAWMERLAALVAAKAQAAR